VVTGTAALPVVEGIMGASFHSSCMVAMQPVSREIVIRSCAVAMTPASACSVHKRRPWLTQEARVSRPDGVRGWGHATRR
jgi:hypothetical protein